MSLGDRQVPTLINSAIATVKDGGTEDRDGARTAALIARIRAREWVVGIAGLGYVGLPLMRAATQAGFRVLGFDIDHARVATLNDGRSPNSASGA